MNPELERELQKDHPEVFKNMGGDPKETCMAWGCEHENGWKDLLKKLCKFIDAHGLGTWHIKANNSNERMEVPAPHAVFQQVKEKFGALRIYFSLENPGLSEELYGKIDQEEYKERSRDMYQLIQGAISFAEYQSCFICERCGQPGKMYRNGWWKTLCEEHAKVENRATE
jgi:hypothetical protein